MRATPPTRRKTCAGLLSFGLSRFTRAASEGQTTRTARRCAFISCVSYFRLYLYSRIRDRLRPRRYGLACFRRHNRLSSDVRFRGWRLPPAHQTKTPPPRCFAIGLTCIIGRAFCGGNFGHNLAIIPDAPPQTKTPFLGSFGGDFSRFSFTRGAGGFAFSRHCLIF